MKRRTVLATSAGCFAGLAGCLSTLSGPSATDESGPRTGTVADGTSMTVELEALQPAVLGLYTDAYSVADGTEGAEYLFVRLAAERDDRPARTDLCFRFDGDEYPPFEADEPEDLHRAYGDGEARYDGDSRSGWVLFELPETGDASDAALRLDDGEWRPSDSLRARLGASPPPLTVDWSVPETVGHGADPTVGFTVANEGAHDGRFVAGLNRSGPQTAILPVAAISRRAPAAETVTWSVTDDEFMRGPGSDELGDGEPDLSYKLHWPGGRRTEGVRVVESADVAGG